MGPTIDGNIIFMYPSSFGLVFSIFSFSFIILHKQFSQFFFLIPLVCFIFSLSYFLIRFFLFYFFYKCIQFFSFSLYFYILSSLSFFSIFNKQKFWVEKFVWKKLCKNLCWISCVQIFLIIIKDNNRSNSCFAVVHPVRTRLHDARVAVT